MMTGKRVAKSGNPLNCDPRGFTLVEMMIATGIMGGLALAAAELLSSVSENSAKSQARQSTQNDLQLIGGALQKTLASGNIRIFGFTGSNPGFPAPYPLSRLVIPQPGYCRDLSVCADQSALLYAAYEKSMSASVPAFCVLDPATSGDPYKVLVDGHDKTYGTTVFQAPKPNGFDVSQTSPEGATTARFAITTNTLITLFNAPIGTAWVATGPVQPWTATQTGPNITGPSGVPLPTKCAQRLSTPAIDQIYQISVRPYVLTQFTGGAEAFIHDVMTSYNALPMQVFGLTIRSLGVTPLPHLNTDKFPKVQVSYSDCTFGVDGSQKLDCSAKPKLTVGPFARMRIDEMFATALFDGPNVASNATRFELLSAGMTPSNSCTSAVQCASLTVDNGAIPGQIDSSEKLDNLASSGFSMIKQEVVKTLRVRLTADPTQGKEELIDVQFPQ